jgi:hypothetical protein
MSKKIVHKKIILLITDGFDNNSRISKDYVKSRIYQQNVMLLILGYTKKEHTIAYLRDLAYSSQEGLYIDLNASENLDSVFNTMTETLLGPTLLVESF